MHIVTGPSGAGKSTFCSRQKDWKKCLFSLDAWAKHNGEVNDANVRETAWGMMVKRLHECFCEGRSPIAVDHVCDSESIESILLPAKSRGYNITVWVLCPDEPDICVERVKIRVMEGGHGMTPSRTGDLYEGALYAATEMSLIADRTHLIDSTDELLPVAAIENYQTHLIRTPPPHWVQAHFCSH